ncbi:MAG: cysteine desulfurase [Clostridiales bacterium]|nr:cysteine desulfurase [Clostridiales bacterium]
MLYTRNVYLDNAATTFADGAVIAKMKHCMLEAAANPSASYSASGFARKELRLARQAVADLIGANPEEIVFTSGGTEANALALWQARGKPVVLSATEHASVIENAKLYGCNITFVFPDSNGVIQPDEVEKTLTPETALVSIQHANNETGVIQPIQDIAKLLKKRHCLFHSDAVQAAGQIPLDVHSLDADFVSLSAHKLYGPRGAGCLYIRRGTSVRPLMAGGGQERQIRSGTENVPAFAGFGLAAQLAAADLKIRTEKEADLRSQLESGLCSLVRDCCILGKNASRVPGICAAYLPGISSEWLIAQLDLQGIQVSGGAACASRSGKPSHVYSAMGLNGMQASEVVRFSLGRHNTQDEILYTLQCLGEILRKHS